MLGLGFEFELVDQVILFFGFSLETIKLLSECSVIALEGALIALLLLEVRPESPVLFFHFSEPMLRLLDQSMKPFLFTFTHELAGVSLVSATLSELFYDPFKLAVVFSQVLHILQSFLYHLNQEGWATSAVLLVLVIW